MKNKINFLSPANIFSLFMFYSIFGWLYEVAKGFINSQGFTSPGALFGPYLPFYGLIGIVVTFLLFNVILPRLRSSSTLKVAVIVFLVFVFSSTIMGFIGDLTLDKLLNIRIWDRGASLKDNVSFYISLLSGIKFGLVGTALFFIFYPGMTKLILRLGRKGMRLQSKIAFFILSFDTIMTLINKYTPLFTWIKGLF